MKTVLKSILATVLLLTFDVVSQAQVADKKQLTLDGAKHVIAVAVEYARAHSAPGGVIAIVDDGGNLMALERLDGTFSAGANISVGKAKTAVMFKRPTKFFEDVIKNGRTAMVALPDFTPLQGRNPNHVRWAIGGRYRCQWRKQCTARRRDRDRRCKWPGGACEIDGVQPCTANKNAACAFL